MNVNYSSAYSQTLGYGCTTCSKTTFRDEQNPNTANLPFAQQQRQPYLSNVHNHADYPIFEQSVLDTDTSLVTYLNSLQSRVIKNESNLRQIGLDMTKIGQDNTYFGTKFTEIDNKLNADHTRFDNTLTSIGNSLKSAKSDRDELHRKIDSHTLNKSNPHGVSTGGGIDIGGGLGMGALIALGLGAFLLTRGKK